NGLVDGVGRAGTFHHVIDTLAAVEALDGLDDVFIADVDHVIGAKLATDFEAIVASPGQDHRLRAQGFGNRNAKEPDRPGTGNDNALAGDEPAEFGEAVHRGAGGDDERRLFVRHGVRNHNQRVDVVDLVFAETAVGRETVGAVALVEVAVIKA